MPNGVNPSKHVLAKYARTYFMMMSIPDFAIIRIGQYWYNLVNSLAEGW